MKYGSSLKVYLNGSSAISQTVSGALYDNGAPLIIGGDTNVNFWIGHIDEVIYETGARWTANFTRLMLRSRTPNIQYRIYPNPPRLQLGIRPCSLPTRFIRPHCGSGVAGWSPSIFPAELLIARSAGRAGRYVASCYTSILIAASIAARIDSGCASTHSVGGCTRCRSGCRDLPASRAGGVGAWVSHLGLRQCGVYVGKPGCSFSLSTSARTSHSAATVAAMDSPASCASTGPLSSGTCHAAIVSPISAACLLAEHVTAADRAARMRSSMFMARSVRRQLSNPSRTTL